MEYLLAIILFVLVLGLTVLFAISGLKKPITTVKKGTQEAGQEEIVTDYILIFADSQKIPKLKSEDFVDSSFKILSQEDDMVYVRSSLTEQTLADAIRETYQLSSGDFMIKSGAILQKVMET